MRLTGKDKAQKKMQKNNRKRQEYILANGIRLINNTNDFATIESYRASRSNIMISLPHDKSCKKVMVTSAMQGDGKTTIAINLALIFAKKNARVLLIDADLRLPMVHTYLNINNKQGLSNILNGQAKFKDTVQRISDIDVITVGDIPENPAELLASPVMAALMEELSAHYDYIFIDTPPVGILVDAMEIIELSTGVILVVRQRHTHHKAVNSAIVALEFAKAKICGFILNDSDLFRYHYKKKKYSSYKYHYNYNYYGSQKQRN